MAAAAFSAQVAETIQQDRETQINLADPVRPEEKSEDRPAPTPEELSQCTPVPREKVKKRYWEWMDSTALAKKARQTLTRDLLAHTRSTSAEEAEKYRKFWRQC